MIPPKHQQSLLRPEVAATPRVTPPNHWVVEAAALPQGDVALWGSPDDDRHQRPLLAIAERKTEADYWASVVDGRWAEQRERFDALPEHVVTIWIIESGRTSGDPERTRLYRHSAALALPRLSHPSCAEEETPKKRPHWVMYTRDPVDTLDHLFAVAYRLHRLYGEHHQEQRFRCGDATMGLPKRCAVNGPKDLLKATLSAIPRLSVAMAEAIIRFTSACTLAEFVEWLRMTVHVEAILAAITVTQKRKLGPALAKKIVEYFFGGAPQGDGKKER